MHLDTTSITMPLVNWHGTYPETSAIKRKAWFVRPKSIDSKYSKMVLLPILIEY